VTLCPLPRPDENPADEWRAYSDGIGEFHVFCPECAGASSEWRSQGSKRRGDYRDITSAAAHLAGCGRRSCSRPAPSARFESTTNPDIWAVAAFGTRNRNLPIACPSLGSIAANSVGAARFELGTSSPPG
jgi:hypothetical protein